MKNYKKVSLEPNALTLLQRVKIEGDCGSISEAIHLMYDAYIKQTRGHLIKELKVGDRAITLGSTINSSYYIIGIVKKIDGNKVFLHQVKKVIPTPDGEVLQLDMENMEGNKEFLQFSLDKQAKLQQEALMKIIHDHDLEKVNLDGSINLTETETKILDLYGEFKSDSLMIQSLHAEVHKWNRFHQDQFKYALDNLQKKGFVKLQRHHLALTEKAKKYLHKDYDIRETEDLILGVFADFKCGLDEVLIINSLMGRMDHWDKCHRDNFEAACENLILHGHIKRSDRDAPGYMLTDLGYNYLYKKNC